MRAPGRLTPSHLQSGAHGTAPCPPVVGVEVRIRMATVRGPSEKPANHPPTAHSCITARRRRQDACQPIKGDVALKVQSFNPVLGDVVDVVDLLIGSEKAIEEREGSNVRRETRTWRQGDMEKRGGGIRET